MGESALMDIAVVAGIVIVAIFVGCVVWISFHVE